MNPEEYYLHIFSVLSVFFVLSIEPQPKNAIVGFELKWNIQLF